MTITLPPEWKIDIQGQHALLCHSLRNCWGTFVIRDGQAKDGRFYCGSVPGNEGKARQDYAEREGLWQTR
jgi:hypothetical protein